MFSLSLSFSFIFFLSVLLFLSLNRFLLMLCLLCQSKSNGACHFSLALLVIYTIPMIYQKLNLLTILLYICLSTIYLTDLTSFLLRMEMENGPPLRSSGAWEFRLIIGRVRHKQTPSLQTMRFVLGQPPLSCSHWPHSHGVNST